MNIKIISWNVWCYNQNFKKIISFLESRNAQIYCLQEVSTELLNYLQKLKKYYLVVANEQTISKKNNFKEFIVILSKFKFIKSKHYKFTHPNNQALRSKIIGFKGNLEYQYIDIKINNNNNNKIRIFNSHLQFNAGPSERVGEFIQMKKQISKNNTNIFCGDFNNFGIWYYNILIGWALNYSLKDYLLNGNKLFQNLFKENNLIDVFKNSQTFPKRHLQLDHILIPKNLKLISHKVIKEMYGSDHRPIEAIINIK